MWWMFMVACGGSAVVPTDPPSSRARGDSADTAASDTGDSAPSDPGSGDSGTGDTAASAPPATGVISVDACVGTTGIAERCTLVTDASACTRAPCDRLVVVFSGGEMGCESGTGYRDVLEGYATRGYAAVCVNYFETPAGSGARPYVDEASRIDTAVQEATTGAWARTYWTGEELLLEGISHGATAPVVLMARTTIEEQAHWKGRSLTAGCFFDGSYDQAVTADLLATGDASGGPCTEPVSHARWLERYCGPGASASTCDLRSDAKAREDSITDVAPARFAIADLRMFECGSELPACSGDIVPSAPIEALCTRLDESAAHRCTFTSLPRDGHLTCHARRYDECRTWFERLSRRAR